jgi:molybdopterin synthase catalytic subunit
MKVRVRFFASAREKARVDETERELAGGARVADLWEALCSEYPALNDLTAAMSFAVNREYAERSQALAEGDEVALIPPVSGG